MMAATAAASSPSVHEKPEAFGLVAGVVGVTVEGDNNHQSSGRSSGLTRDLVPSFGVNRKKRMARQRRPSSTIKLLSFTSSTTSHVPCSTLPPRVSLRFLFSSFLAFWHYYFPICKFMRVFNKQKKIILIFPFLIKKSSLNTFLIWHGISCIIINI